MLWKFPSFSSMCHFTSSLAYIFILFIVQGC
nr:MAG TPA: hypothetical protein [Bacteriophage sp.]